MRTTKTTAHHILKESADARSKQVWPYLAIALVITAMDLLGFLLPLRRLSEWLTQPLFLISSQIVHTTELPFLVIKRSFQNYRYIQDLELRYAETVAQLDELDALKKENQELRGLVVTTTKPILAPILAYSQPYLGKGRHDGVQVGNLVLIGQTLIGQITEVSDLQSSMTLFTAVGTLPILVQTESGITGVAVGNGSQLLMTEIPQDAELKVNDRVTTIGQKEIPAGLSVGKIRAVVQSTANSSQMAEIDQIVSFYDSRLVEIKL